MTKFTEKQAAAQYEIISKLSLSEVLDSMSRGYENPISPKSIKQGDTILYAQGFGRARIERYLKTMLRWKKRGKNVNKKLSLFIVGEIYESDDSEVNPLIRYWMYEIKFVSDTLFDDTKYNKYGRTVFLKRIDRPTIVFNVDTGKKWICDWRNPQVIYHEEGGSTVIAPPLHFHSGSHAIFTKDEIVILNLNILSDNFINWLNVNPLEVKP